jgi:tellurite resistance protein TehA-like permease
MATGIVSISARLLGFPLLAEVLFWVNGAAFATLWVLTLVRIARFPREVLADLSDHQRGVGFFTAVAASSVFGSQFVVLHGAAGPAFALWILTIVLWAGLVYAVFTLLTVKEEKPTLDAGIHGGWLVAVVATESVSTLGSLLARSFPEHTEAILFAALVFWLAGGMLYMWLISLIFYRYTFFRFLPSDLSPPYWINMGAMAISTLAGAFLCANASLSPLLGRMVPFLLGFTLFFWATATWWIPMLLILGFWRHVLRRFPLEYHPLYWGAVFPLGMYTACTYRLADVTGLSFLFAVPRVFLWIAVVAWSLAFVGLLRRVVRLAVSSG